MTGPRPPVTVIVPFCGSPAHGRGAIGRLAALRLGPGDEVLVADNTPEAVLASIGRVTVFSATIPRAVYAARNEAAERAACSWLLFLDDDCQVPADLIDRYFARPPAPDTGAVAGGLVGAPGRTVAARYATSRRLADSEPNLRHPHLPMAVTGNLLVRREAFEGIGGFLEGVRSGADADLSWRLQEAGWAIEHRPDAIARQDHRERLVDLLRQSVRDGAGAAWANRRRPGCEPRLSLAAKVVRGTGAAVLHALRGRWTEAGRKLLDVAWAAARWLGYLLGNAGGVISDRQAPAVSVVVLADEYPAVGGDAVAAALRERGVGGSVRVEAVRRPCCGGWEAVRGIPARWEEDEGIAGRALALAWLTLRHTRMAVRAGRRAPGLAPVARRLARGQAAAVLAAAPGRVGDAALLAGLAQAASRADAPASPSPERSHTGSAGRPST